jgi:phage gp36-like protein
MADPYITRAQLENRLSKIVVQRIFDDNNDGSADANPVNQLLKDASSKLRSTLGQLENLDELTAESDTADEVTRLCLDIAQAYAAQRFPEFVRVDGFKLMKQAEADLARLRMGFTNLGTNQVQEPVAFVVSDPPRGW